MTKFIKGQEVTYKGETVFFDGISGRGGNGEYCFIFFKTPNRTGKQVKLSEIAAKWAAWLGVEMD